MIIMKKKNSIFYLLLNQKKPIKYVTYTDYSKDYKGKIRCWSSYFEGEELHPVKTENELRIIDEMLRTLSRSTELKYSIEE